MIMFETARLFTDSTVALRVLTHFHYATQDFTTVFYRKTRKLRMSRAVNITMNRKDGKQLLH